MDGIERHWQSVTPVSAALYPVSLVFRTAVALRRGAYARSLLRSVQLPVPVVVVGNITVGGTGKTPLVLWLAAFLSEHGMRPGIVSRGYGAAVQEATAVTANADPRRFGDEPVLLARRSGCPVYIGRDRPGAAAALLRAHPDCDVILSDDGLQHYRLARDFEIAVLDGTRRLGNGLMLPAGPLREPPSRLRSVDALVINGPGTVVPHNGTAVFRMALEGSAFTNLLNPRHTAGPEQFQRRRVHAIAGIGNPERFFGHLRALGLEFEPHAFPDHHEYSRQDLEYGRCDAIVMTEKDAVKCAAFATEKQWALRVDAAPDAALGERVLIALRQQRKSP